ncbi:FK506-binding protein 4 [Holothuria leucospilota]|uniref:FK506-binding protein 4 n=1 Tax=Holothuria leucospilota TaxID=206669 RepID=A0A9Q1CTK3_HOLLE|nr:FK506-binding protein 4 [Holothuria leucospilota]
MFWGMTLYPGVEYTREIKRPEYLTLAALDCRPQMNRGETNLTAYLVLKCDNYEHVLCTLVQGHAHQQILNFVMQEGEKMTLTVEGSGKYFRVKLVFSKSSGIIQHYCNFL